MTPEEIAAALTLASRVTLQCVGYPVSVTANLSTADAKTLADLIRRLAGEVKTLQGVLSDATAESLMYRHGYERGVTDALAAIHRDAEGCGGTDPTARGLYAAASVVLALLESLR